VVQGAGVLPGITVHNRRIVIRLARVRECIACNDTLSDSSTGDHLVALANGGPAGGENFVSLCGHCNSLKGTYDFLDFWRKRGGKFTDLSPDVLTAYVRLTYAAVNRLNRLNKPASVSLVAAVDDLMTLLPGPEHERILRGRVSWITGRRWT
jgi:hypothetical protein